MATAYTKASAKKWIQKDLVHFTPEQCQWKDVVSVAFLVYRYLLSRVRFLGVLLLLTLQIPEGHREEKV